MTIIAGYTTGKHVWLGADSLASNGYTGVNYRDSKVFRNGPFLIGVTGSIRVSQVLRYKFSPGQPPADDSGLMRWMVNDFIDEFRECLDEAGCLRKDSEVEEGGEFLVGYGRHLFHIESDFQVGNPSTIYDAAGSGEDLALGAISAAIDYGADYGRPDKLLVVAMEAASRFSVSCSGPYTIVTNDPSGWEYGEDYRVNYGDWI
ncbi:MAG: hypothetical protein LC687_07820, partial [Actinobacteria bacterium]|nr:hypothetical protein [Actinomycetota bacterium]